jgi:prepilin-type N-terminal cleavage/methylation domain-containing protein
MKTMQMLPNTDKKAFTMVEMLIAVVLTTMIVFFAYRIFFSQTEVVTKSIEFMQVNDSFRKVMTFMGNDPGLFRYRAHTDHQNRCRSQAAKFRT